ARRAQLRQRIPAAFASTPAWPARSPVPRNTVPIRRPRRSSGRRAGWRERSTEPWWRWFPSTEPRRKGKLKTGDRRPGATRPWYNERMPGFRVETPQRAYDAIVERGSLARIAEFLPARAGKLFVVTTADGWGFPR